MAYKLFPRVPVADLERSRSFYQALGWRTALSMEQGHSTTLDLGEAFGVTLVEQRFERRFVQQAVDEEQGLSDPGRTVIGSFTLVVDIPEEVDALVERAVAAGATAGNREDDRYTSRRVFADPDGHRWTIVWADPFLWARD